MTKQSAAQRNHDIKSMLMSIKAYAQLINKKNTDIQIKKYSEQLNKNIDTLIEMIKEIC